MQTALIVVDVQQSFTRRPYFRSEGVAEYLAHQNALIEGATARGIMFYLWRDPAKPAADEAEFKFIGIALLWPRANKMPIDLNTVTAHCIGKRKAFVAERLVSAAHINDKGILLMEFQGLARYRLSYFRPAVLRPMQ